jgi:ADP-ribosylglycohydrolase
MKVRVCCLAKVYLEKEIELPDLMDTPELQLAWIKSKDEGINQLERMTNTQVNSIQEIIFEDEEEEETNGPLMTIAPCIASTN